MEARIQELTRGNHADAELEEVRKRNEELEAEVRQLSENLALLGDDDSSTNLSLSTSRCIICFSIESNFPSPSFHNLKFLAD